LIEYGRGRIRVLDRRGLEQRSCECYGVVERAYEQLRSGASTRTRPDWAPERVALASRTAGPRARPHAKPAALELGA